MSSTDGIADERSITIVYTNNSRFDQQSKRRIRTHAARWSRTHGSHKAAKKQRGSCPVSIKGHKAFTDSTVLRSIKKEHTDSPDQSPPSQTTRIRPSAMPSDAFSFGSKLDPFQALPQLPLEQARPDALSVAKSHMSTVLGEEFVGRNIPLNASQSTVMYVGSLLIT